MILMEKFLSKQGKYQQTGVLWSPEELNGKASNFIRERAAVKGEPNLKTATFCEWVNKVLLPNVSLERERSPLKLLAGSFMN